MVLIYNSPRTILRKSIRIHQRISSIQKRPKATLTEKSVSKGPQPLTQISKSDVGYGLRLWHRFGSPYKLVQAYGRAQNTRPYATQVGSLVVIWCCGDLLAQSMEEEDYNPWRTLRHMVIGAVVAIPSYKWFMYLGQSFNYASKVRSLATKVVVNQIVFAPLFGTYFFGMQSLLVGDNPVEVWERIKNTVPISWINSCKLWPAVTAFNFTYIQPQSRPIFAGLIAVGWQAYLSWLNQRAANKEKAQKLTAATSN